MLFYPPPDGQGKKNLAQKKAKASWGEDARKRRTLSSAATLKRKAARKKAKKEAEDQTVERFYSRSAGRKLR